MNFDESLRHNRRPKTSRTFSTASARASRSGGQGVSGSFGVIEPVTEIAATASDGPFRTCERKRSLSRMGSHIRLVLAPALAALFLGVLLAGCSNRVVSNEPWFSREEHAPRLRPGLWVQQVDSECAFDERQSAEAWPDCATSFVVREQDILHLNWVETETATTRERTYNWSSVAYVLVSGDPMIQQVSPCRDLGPQQVNAEGEPVPETIDPRAYCYFALRPERFDAAGQVESFVGWPVYCGPWPTEEEAERLGRAATGAPFPGLHVVYENCTAENSEAIRLAARASEPIAGDTTGLFSARWVRDGHN